jgi:AcrR family transcriptional regulator
MTSRLTRKERQAHTRQCLLHSAARVFARRGLQHASIDEVAEDAGFTKGAFYANFKSKEELFLAMLDERFAEKLRQLDDLLAGDDEPQLQARRAGEEFARYIAADPEWQRLFFEFSAYAARNPEFRDELVVRYRTLRARIADAYRERAARDGLEMPISPEQTALMTFAMCNGMALESLLEPEEITEETYGTMLETFFTGIGALAAARAGERQ